MTDRIIERQAIRAALTLAAASAHGVSPDAIADMRDEAGQLIGLCINEGGSSDAVRSWCDEASLLMERLSTDGDLPRSFALGAIAAILRLRLAVAQKTPLHRPGAGVHARTPKKKIVQSPTVPQIAVAGNQKIVMEYIAGHPDIRTKNLIDSLNGSLSPRTLKRCLKELCDAGLLKRTRQNDRGVVYRVDTGM